MSDTVVKRRGRQKKEVVGVEEMKKESNEEFNVAKQSGPVVESAVDGLGSFEILEDPLRIRGASRLSKKTRARAGWHQVWKHPDEIDDAKEVGYRFVRENKGDEDVGKETGTIIQVSRDDKVELYLMEVEQWKFDQHLKAISAESRSKYGVLRDGFKQQVEEVNVRIGGHGREIGVIDESD
jgi:hypothetical protein